MELSFPERPGSAPSIGSNGPIFARDLADVRCLRVSGIPRLLIPELQRELRDILTRQVRTSVKQRFTVENPPGRPLRFDAPAIPFALTSAAKSVFLRGASRDHAGARYTLELTAEQDYPLATRLLKRIIRLLRELEEEPFDEEDFLA